MTTVKIDAGVLEKAANALDAARKTFNFYVEEHRKKGSAYDKIKRNEDIRDLCDEALTTLTTAQPQPEVTAEDDKNLIASLRRRQIYHGGYDPDEPDKQCIRAAQRIEELTARLGTEISMHQAWRKRAEEAESTALSAPAVQDLTWTQFSAVAAEWSQHHSREFDTLAAYYEHRFPHGLRIVRGEGEKL